MSKFANADEIAYAHSILLEGHEPFEADKIAIIECNESKDIKACPGSGKTTTLLAKLIILANRLPLPDNQGICVLTHTNVAINEIKDKLGHKADVLFRYPNHFGTIQSFIDKFLAIPMYREMYNKPVRRIDNDVAFFQIDKNFSYKRFEEKQCLYNQIKDRLPVLIPNGKKTALVDALELNLIKNTWIKFDTDGTPVFYRNFGDTRALAKTPTANIYKLLYSVRVSAIENGLLTFQDAYSFASRYCDKHPNTKDAFSSRFKYLFIDEMQDTDELQLDIITRLFDPEKTIIQKFGDHHQAIYNSVKGKQCWLPTNVLPINTSKRFGESIVKILRTVCIEHNPTIAPNPKINSISPIIIVFDDPKTVLPKYCELLKEKRLGDKTLLEVAQENNALHKIKAVGWVGKEHSSADKLSLKSYFDKYNQNTKQSSRVSYNSLKSFLLKNDGSKAKEYADKIIDALLNVLALGSVKLNINGRQRHFNKSLFLEYYMESYPAEYLSFKDNLARWCLKIQNSTFVCDETYEEIKTFIRTDFNRLFGFDSNASAIKTFIDHTNIPSITPENIETKNIYIKDDIAVEVATIHSVKGETHFSTLYLETSYYDEYESNRIMEYLGGNFTTPTKDRTKETLKMVYVGMSRPQYMLCMAIHKSRFDDRLDKDKHADGQWEIIDIS